MIRKIVFVIGLFCCGAACAATCEPGYFPENGECAICPEDYMCPDGKTVTQCGENWYTPDVGATQCVACPTTITETDGFSHFWTWHESHGVNACRAEWEIRTEHGYLVFSCAYFDGYDNDTESYSRCMSGVSSCDAGYYYNPYFAVKRTEYTHWTNSYADAKKDPCQPVGAGRYSPETSRFALTCPANTSTRTDTAASAEECLPLCGGGATRLHAGNYNFNLWAQKHTSPAIHIKTPSGTVCYVSLQEGSGAGINVRYNGKIYHTVN